MFEKGEYIIYGNNGVCEVQDYMRADDMGRHRMYYVLSPIRSKGSTIFSPVDNRKVFMRRVMTKEEAHELLRDISAYEDMEIPETRTQEQHYKEILHNCDYIQSFRLIKALYRRKKQREAAGRKITVLDEKYLFLAKDCLLNELAIALEMDVDDVDQMLAEKILAEENINV